MVDFNLNQAALTRKKIKGIIILGVICLFGFVMLIPFLWMISTSLKISTEVFATPPQWIPWPPQWINYLSAWAPKGLPETFNTYLKNTLIITFFNTLGAIVSSSFVAFGFARLRFKGRDFLFILLLGTMMIPVQVTMIPQFILFRSLGWIDTFLPLIVPNFFAISAFNVFLLRQFFMTLPPELDEAALIDGCSYFDIYWRIIMPLSWPVVATIAVFSFVYNWNDFLNPLIYLNSSQNFTLALGLQTFTTVYGSSYHLMMAASMLMLLPIIVVFFIGQKYFIEGIATTGLKG
jgi:ABC-type glycerol-3-phosphate transport system permease component